MSRHDGLVSGTDRMNGLASQTRGRRPGPVGGLGGVNKSLDDFIAANTKTYRKHAWSLSINESGAFVAERRLLYEVTVKGDGSILVASGDWLSKYSDAIHGNPWKWREYGRKNDRGRIVPIDNVDLIRAGETIYHLPSIPRVLSWDISYPSDVTLTDARRLEIALEHLKKAKGIDDDVLKNIGDVLSGFSDASGQILQLVDIIDTLADIFGGCRWASAVSESASVGYLGAVGVFLGFVLIPVQMADLGRRDFGVHTDAAIAATVAYAFDDAKPLSPPTSTINNIRQMYPQDISEYREKWRAVVEQTYAHLRTIAVRQVRTQILRDGERPVDPELLLKLSLRMIGENERHKLRAALRKKYEKE